MPIFDRDLTIKSYNKKVSKEKLIDLIESTGYNTFNIVIKVDFATHNNDVEFNFISKDYKKLHDFIHGE